MRRLRGFQRRRLGGLDALRLDGVPIFQALVDLGGFLGGQGGLFFGLSAGQHGGLTITPELSVVLKQFVEPFFGPFELRHGRRELRQMGGRNLGRRRRFRPFRLKLPCEAGIFRRSGLALEVEIDRRDQKKRRNRRPDPIEKHHLIKPLIFVPRLPPPYHALTLGHTIALDEARAPLTKRGRGLT
jgi:hypothetical protein